MAQDTSLAAYSSLGADLNKRKGEASSETKQGIVSDKMPELTLDMPDEDILKLTAKWKKGWDDSSAKQDWKKQGEENEKYWLGKHHQGPADDKDRPMVDNLIFESLETYLPQATRRNPEPIVSLDASEKAEDGTEDPVKTRYVSKIKGKLADIADKKKLRLKLKRGARHWSIYLLGVAKFGWDLDQNMPAVRIIRPTKIILDPEATIDEDGYSGDYIGEYRKLSADKILKIIGVQEDQTNPEDGKVTQKGNGDAVNKINETVKENTATSLQFIEWWTAEYVCWEFDKTILFKKKNPHWNYDQQQPGQPTSQVDDYGVETQTPGEPQDIPGINHFTIPKMPYEFLTVFNLGDQPMDKTSLIGQNLANQDLINKRNKQIDKNADRMNGGMVVSLERSGLTSTQAKGVSEAIRKGGVVVIPAGSPKEAIDTYQTPALPPDVFGQLNDTRARLRDIFGVKGSSQAGLQGEDTVRGKIISRGLDTDRIGGGVTEYLEQFADDIYNWCVQLLYVYDDAFQFLGGGVPPKIVVSVKEGSLLPKDSMTIANQALELAKMNKISNLDLYKILEYPNPEELAANVWLEVNAPQLLYKNNQMVQQAIAMAQQAAQQTSEDTANQDAMSKEQDHAMGMERDMTNNANKMRVEELKAAKNEGKPAGRSILSAVPTQ
jgi:hypothetical protein